MDRQVRGCLSWTERWGRCANNCTVWNENVVEPYTIDEARRDEILYALIAAESQS